MFKKVEKDNWKTKPIKMRYHYIKEAITEHDVIQNHISRNSIVAYPLIKPIARDAFVRYVRSLSLYRM
jgi:hypothetical protein